MGLFFFDDENAGRKPALHFFGGQVGAVDISDLDPLAGRGQWQR